MSSLSISGPSNEPCNVSKRKGLFDLPGEIRNKIYRLLLGPETAILGTFEDPRRTEMLFERDSFIDHITGRATESALGPGEIQEDLEFPRRTVAYRYKSSLLSVNRQIYEEASPIFYEENRFICFLTSYPALYRVLRECGFMRSSPSLSNDRWIATFKLRWNVSVRNRFIFIIPLQELGILARIFRKASSSKVLFFSNCDLRIITSDCLPSVSSELVEAFLEPIRQLYNLLQIAFDDRLRPHMQSGSPMILPNQFCWFRFLTSIKRDLGESVKLYTEGDLTHACQWGLSASKDLDGARDVHYLAWDDRGGLVKVRSTMVRQDLALWLYKVQLEMDLSEGFYCGDDDQRLRLPTFHHLDEDSKTMVWYGWEVTCALGHGDSKRALTFFDRMDGFVWTGGPLLARCIHREIQYAAYLWRTCCVNVSAEFEEDVTKMIRRDNLRPGWMELESIFLIQRSRLEDEIGGEESAATEGNDRVITVHT